MRTPRFASDEFRKHFVQGELLFQSGAGEGNYSVSDERIWLASANSYPGLIRPSILGRAPACASTGSALHRDPLGCARSRGWADRSPGAFISPRSSTSPLLRSAFSALIVSSIARDPEECWGRLPYSDGCPHPDDQGSCRTGELPKPADAPVSIHRWSSRGSQRWRAGEEVARIKPHSPDHQT